MRDVRKELHPTLMLAIPVAFGSASVIFMGVIDSLMIGRVGTVPLAGSAFTCSIFSFFFLVESGFLIPVSVLVARYSGAGKPKECAEWLRHGMIFAFGLGLLGVVAMGTLALRLDLFDQPPEVMEEALPFFLLFGISLLPTMLFQVLRQYSEALGLAWMPMLILLGTVALNAGLNWVFIYGNFGFPEMGLVGAGFGTLLARIASFVVLYFWLRSKLHRRDEWPKGDSFRQRWLRPLQGSFFGELTRLGLPSAGQIFFEVCAFSAAGVMMGWISTKALAAHQIALSCCSLTFMVPLGLSIAASMRMSSALGARQYAKIRHIGLASFGMTWVSMGCFAIIMLLFGKRISSLFIQDQEVVRLAANFFTVAAFFQLFDGTQVVGTGSLRGLSDIKIPTYITGFAYSAVAIPMSYAIGVRNNFPEGVWIGLAAGLAIAAVALFWRFMRETAQLASTSK